MMWYEKILKALILKVYQNDRDEALLHLEEVLFQIELLATSLEPVPAELLLGLIGAMYKKYHALKDDSVPLEDFSLTLLGLALIYSKASFEIEEIWTVDFEYIWANSGIVLFLDDEAQSFKELLPSIFILEMQTLKLLNDSIKIDWDYLLEILSLKEFAHLKDDIYNDFEYLLGADEGEVFTEFLYKVKQIPISSFLREELQPDLHANALDSTKELSRASNKPVFYANGTNKAHFFQPVVMKHAELEYLEFGEFSPLLLHTCTLM